MKESLLLWRGIRKFQKFIFRNVEISKRGLKFSLTCHINTEKQLMLMIWGGKLLNKILIKPPTKTPKEISHIKIFYQNLWVVDGLENLHQKVLGKTSVEALATGDLDGRSCVVAYLKNKVRVIFREIILILKMS